MAKIFINGHERRSRTGEIVGVGLVAAVLLMVVLHAFVIGPMLDRELTAGRAAHAAR